MVTLKSKLQALLSTPTFTEDRGVAYAEVLCKMAHWDQIDRDGKPHWEHCVSIAKKMSTGELKIIALLHDVFEDCKNKDILKKVNDFIMPIKNVNFSVLTLTQRYGEGRSAYIRRILSSNENTLIAKIGDLEHNLSRLEPERVTKRRQYERELRILRKALWRLNNLIINNDEKQDIVLAKMQLI